MARNELVVKDMGFDGLISVLGKLAGDEPAVLVGFLGSGEGGDDSVVAYAAANEFGGEDDDGQLTRPPERPFMRTTADANRPRYESQLAEGIGRVLDGLGRPGGATIAGELDRVGAAAAGDVKQTIRDLRDPPNAPSTVAAKGSSNPLIDSGTMRRAVTHRVRIGGDS